MSVSDSSSADVKFLLSLQVLLDLCGPNNNPAHIWAVKTDRLRLSVLTVAQAHSIVSSATDTQDRDRLSSRLSDLLATLKADGGPLLLFTERAAQTWQSYMREPTLGDLSQVDRQFYAVAFSEGLCVVEYDHQYTSALAPLGIKVHSLGIRP